MLPGSNQVVITEQVLTDSITSEGYMQVKMERFKN